MFVCIDLIAVRPS